MFYVKQKHKINVLFLYFLEGPMILQGENKGSLMEIKFNLKFTMIFKFNVCLLFKSGKVVPKLVWRSG